MEYHKKSAVRNKYFWLCLLNLTNTELPSKQLNPNISLYVDGKCFIYTCSIFLMSSSGDGSSPLSFLILFNFLVRLVSLSFVSDSYGTEKQPHHQDTIKTVDSFKALTLSLHRCTECIKKNRCIFCLIYWLYRSSVGKATQRVKLAF